MLGNVHARLLDLGGDAEHARHLERQEHQEGGEADPHDLRDERREGDPDQAAAAVEGAYAYHGTLDDGCKGGGGVGLFYGEGCLIGVTVATLIAEIVWVGGTSLVLFGGLRFAGLLRVNFESEDLGLDVSKHGGAAYETNVFNNEGSKRGGSAFCENNFTRDEASLDHSKHGGTLFSRTSPPPLVSTALAAVSRSMGDRDTDESARTGSVPPTPPRSANGE